MFSADGFRDGEFPKEFTMEALWRAIEAKKSRLLFGDLDRVGFGRAVFTQPIDTWPMGHLQDHRVSVPDDLAESHLEADDKTLAALLSRFLCHSDRKGSRELIADALALSPMRDAQTLIEVRGASPELFLSLLRGRLDEVWPLSTNLSLSWKATRAAMRLMLLYYGALDLQLIAARSRAFAEFDFGAAGKGSTPTVGGLLNGWEGRTKAIIYANKAADDHRPAGASPAWLASAEAEGREILAMLGLSDKDPVPPDLAALLSELAPVLEGRALPAVDAWRATAEENPPKDPTDPKKPKPQPIGARMELATLFEGLTPGKQIGYASLRLESLVSHTDDLLPHKGVHARHFSHWNRRAFRDGADGPSLVLYFVNQAVIMEDAQTCASNLDLESVYIEWCRQDEGGKASTLLKSLRAGNVDDIPKRSPAADDEELIGSARYDILPDFRLGLGRTSVSGAGESGRRKRKNVLPNHIQQHGVVRLPKRNP